MDISRELGQAIWAHGQACFPRECCGLVIDLAGVATYVPCTNIAPAGTEKDRFVIDPSEWAAAEDRGEILAVVHSHPNASANPSDADRAMCERTGVPWIVIGVPSGVIKQCEPTGQPLPLVGRTFHHGVVDCYTLIRDYYQVRLGIELPDYERDDEWWAKGPDGQPGQDLYERLFSDAGFVCVGQARDLHPQPHDVILIQIRAEQSNHAAIMDSDHPGQILHHLYGRLSGHDVWGGMWRHHSTRLLRHRNLLEVNHVG